MRAAILPLFILVILAFVAAFMWLSGPMSSRGAPPIPGAAKASMEIGGHFALTSQHGKPVTSDDLKGRFQLIYFGYTFCPDICPADMLTLSRVLDAFEGKDNAPYAVFITVDPERDTVEHLAKVMQNFHPNMLALTGDEVAIEQAKKSFKIYSAKATPDGTMAEYLVDHSTFTYLLSPDGAYITHFNHGTDAQTIIKHINRAMAEAHKKPAPPQPEEPQP